MIVPSTSVRVWLADASAKDWENHSQTALAFLRLASIRLIEASSAIHLALDQLELG